MLKKLMKYDMRAISKSASPLLAASGIVSVICCAILYFTYGFSEDVGSIANALAITSGFYILGVITIAVLWAVTALIGISGYYRSLFTDEGYLNMVIPVKTSTLFAAKLLSTFIWVMLATVVAGACAIIAIYIPTVLYDPELISTAAEDIKWILGFGEGVEGIAASARILELVGGVFSFVCNMFIIVTAITLGSVTMRKHRVMGCIMFYFAINFVGELIISAADQLMGLAFGEAHADAAALTSAIFALVLYVAVCVLMYFANLYILDKKFNIE